MTTPDQPVTRRGRRAVRIAVLCIIAAALLAIGALPLLSSR